MTPDRMLAAVRMRTEGKSLDAIAATLGVGRSSVSRALDQVDKDADPAPQLDTSASA